MSPKISKIQREDNPKIGLYSGYLGGLYNLINAFRMARKQGIYNQDHESMIVGLTNEKNTKGRLKKESVGLGEKKQIPVYIEQFIK